jgi:hypothetical protein
MVLCIPFFLITSIYCNSDNTPFDSFFKDKTMRVDFFHSGNSTEEHFAIDKILSDGKWPGNKSYTIDDLDLGVYKFEIFDKETGTLIFSQGYTCIYEEWESTTEAKKQWGTFHESLRFPWPKKPIKISVLKRNKQNLFIEKWNTEADPNSHCVNPTDRINTNNIITIMENGPADKKVDIIILGDGYTKDEMKKFRKDIDRLLTAFFNTEPFKSRKPDFNIRAIETPSDSSGVTRPNFDVYKRSPLSVQYSIFDSERYALTYDNRTVRDIASAVPYDFMWILINEKNYGGGGIYKLYATTAVDTAFSDYIFIHEFGHHFAALTDEYYTSQVSYELDNKITVEPWEPNITALLDKNNLKWKNLVKPGTPIPTPWNKEEFDSYSNSIQSERQKLRDEKAQEEEMNVLLLGEKQKEAEMVSKMKYKDEVGAFEGAGYYYKGMYRPCIDCIMFTRNIKFCPVCQQAIIKVINRYSR